MRHAGVKKDFTYFQMQEMRLLKYEDDEEQLSAIDSNSMLRDIDMREVRLGYRQHRFS